MGWLDGITGGGGGGGGGLIGGALGSISTGFGWMNTDASRNSMNQAYDYTADLQNSQFQDAMYASNTAHQREVADLRKAGLNPILSAGGQGASTPSPGMGTMSPMSDPGWAARGMSSVMDAVRLDKDLQVANKGLSVADADIAYKTAGATAALAGADKDKTSAKLGESQNKALTSQLDAISDKAKLDSANARTNLRFQGLDQSMKRVGEGLGLINSAKDAINPFKGGGNGLRPWQGKTPGGDVYDRGTGELIQP